MVQLGTREFGFLKQDYVSDGQVLLQTASGKPAVSASGAAAAAAVVGSGSGARAGAALEERKGKFGVQPPPGRERGAPSSAATGVNGSRQPPNMARLRLGSNRGFSPIKDSQPPGKFCKKHTVFTHAPLALLAGDVWFS